VNTSRRNAADPLFARSRVSTADERVFLGKLIILGILAAAGVTLALQAQLIPVVLGVVLLGAMFTHAVELQHQCLHHSAFRRAGSHRLVGFPLGVPLLVIYSHYRTRHLQHHRNLGTENDTEFFGFDTRAEITVPHLLRGLFDYGRIVVVLSETCRAVSGRWHYERGDVPQRVHRQIVTEHVIVGALVVGAVAAALAGYWQYPLRLWLLPLLVAVPMHFLVELPEHILCDTDTTDVLRNTRTIRGSRLSTWFTNGNNLHVEHHAAMNVPINRLPARHPEVAERAKHVQRNYLSFYRLLWKAVRGDPATAVRGK
jgi:fatty acid desaturase